MTRTSDIDAVKCGDACGDLAAARRNRLCLKTVLDLGA